jgi:HEAT repeat protein
MGALLAVAALLACGGDDGYLEQLRRGTSDERAQAAAFLGAQRDVRAVPHLIAALQDTVPSVRAKAAWALGMVGGKEALPALVACLSDTSLRVRQQAGLALMGLEEPEAIAALQAALRAESDPWVRGDLQRAIEYLRQFEGEADLSEGTFR